MEQNTEKRREANKKRAKTLTNLKHKNMQLAYEMSNYLRINHLSRTKEDFINKLHKRLCSCSNNTLYALCASDLELITHFTCKHKMCNICNWHRKKSVRRKYYKFFNENEYLYLFENKGKEIIVTASNLNKYKDEKYNLLAKIQYDLMHLTLTVPHTVDGWKGEKYYYKEIKEAFNKLRKSEVWKTFVLGGEYGVETTHGDNGYHIHIHSLLLVRKSTQNRNKLHLALLKEWNKLTYDKAAKREKIDDYSINKILKSNALLKKEDILSLNPKGTTLIGLECIYTKNDKGQKVRSTEWGSDAMYKAVMETISYHFKPKMFDMKNGRYDIEMIVDLLPKIHKQTLYYKFGCLEKEKTLNVNSNDITEELNEVNEMIDYETGEVLQKTFHITNPRNIRFDGAGNPKFINKTILDVIDLHALGTKEALNQMKTIYMKKQEKS